MIKVTGYETVALYEGPAAAMSYALWAFKLGITDSELETTR